jgi:putative PIN family toxin of toxin-antitoxin system
MKVVFDTCIWVAAVRSRRGASFALLSEIPHGRFRFGISIPLFTEYSAKLMDASASGKSRLTAAQTDAILQALAHFGTEVPIYYQLRPNLRDENDNMVFECAANFQAKAIVTHNIKDFLAPELRGYDIEPMTPGAFLERMRREK